MTHRDMTQSKASYFCQDLHEVFFTLPRLGRDMMKLTKPMSDVKLSGKYSLPPAMLSIARFLKFIETL